MNTYQRLVAKVGVEEARRIGRERASNYRAKNKDRLNEAARTRKRERRGAFLPERRAWQERNREYLRWYAREHYRKNREVILERRSAYHQANRHKDFARSLVRREVKAGRMIKPDLCELCGKGGIIEAHHHNYERPLAVEWLCRKCHRSLHRLVELAVRQESGAPLPESPE